MAAAHFRQFLSVALASEITGKAGIEMTLVNPIAEAQI